MHHIGTKEHVKKLDDPNIQIENIKNNTKNKNNNKNTNRNTNNKNNSFKTASHVDHQTISQNKHMWT